MRNVRKVDLDRAVERYLAAMAPVMRPATVECYRCGLSSLLRYLRKAHPDIRSFDALERTPHVTGWLKAMAAHEPPYSVDTEGGSASRPDHEKGLSEGQPSSPKTACTGHRCRAAAVSQA